MGLLSLYLPPSPLPLSLKDPPNRTSPAVLGIALYVMWTDGGTRETCFIPFPYVLPGTSCELTLPLAFDLSDPIAAVSHADVPRTPPLSFSP